MADGFTFVPFSSTPNHQNCTYTSRGVPIHERCTRPADGPFRPVRLAER